MSSLCDPAITVLYLFSAESLPLRGVDTLCGPWEAIDRLALKREVDEAAAVCLVFFACLTVSFSTC